MRAPTSTSLRRTLILATAGLLAFACGGGADTPAPVPDAAPASAPPQDPTAWVRALAADLPAALRARVAAAESVRDAMRRISGVKRLDIRQPVALERLYAAEGAGLRYMGEDAPTPLGEHLMARMGGIKADGLDPAVFHADDLDRAAKRMRALRAEVDALPRPPAPTEAEVARLIELARTLPAGAGERALLDRIVAADGPLPAWAAYSPAFETAQKAVVEARVRIEARLADGLLHYMAVMAFGNLTSEARAARRAVAAAAPAPATAAPSDGPGAATEEHGGAGSDTDDDEVAAPISAPPGTTLPPILADRKAFLAERLATRAAAATDAAGIDAIFTEATPRHPQYALLKAALARYRAVGDEGFIEVKPRAGLALGSSGALVEKLQKRLAQEGLFTGTPNGAFDAATEAAVQRFQRAHRLEATGRMGERTWDELEVPLVRRVKNLDRALDALRGSKIDEEDFFVLVNIPDFKLQVWREGKRILENKVVVGKASGTVCDEKTRHLTLAYATPRLSAEMSQLVIAPYWLVTKDIKEKEYDPQRARDPQFYERNGYEVIDRGSPNEWVRQLPSPANSLGLVKMLFPNQFAVYIHDTPQKQYFEQSYRAASHGCVRLDQPQQLAQLVLEHDGQWDAAKFEQLRGEWEAMGRLLKPYDPDKFRKAQSKALDLQTEIPLKDPIPVHLEYYTAQVADDGTVEFLHDLYGHDIHKWSPKNAPACVPESQSAREGTENVSDEVDHLESQAVALGKRIDGLPKHIAKLQVGDKDAKFLAARAKGLSTFVESQKTYAETVRKAQAKVEKALERNDGKWTRELQAEAVKVKRLVDGLRKANDRAKTLCEDVERRGR
jgi:hypothetical protein